ncbi:MAG: DUF3617 domain-containing protein [Candidatus Thiodiazotropha sp. (ex. Lucinisca nassula)]|nr:DUF3617 domain-containing protein [Candidatus Thiodiazotropha sp. (ex. Lucinisca nassula)]MBW9272869.1 DUF3617 domain-containing protein [Candidatus Thiodiazotropha sp. (ex. Lucinisca nassula)]PUB74603.1 MAG: hypothetical protein DBP01_19105 [gamma proteobacterium symbiont of Ctena orbiculata]PUB86421.1 MAG: hypothetical protein DBP02_03185 [gamma proteobacterium symbiont of Ctena orbiculata]
MNFRKIAISLSFFLLLSKLSDASEVNMNPGKWQWTAVLNMPGMPIQLPPTSYTTCITRADFVPKESKLGQACENIDLTTEGDKVSWNISCTKAAGVTRSHGSITYHGDSAEGVINIDVEGVQVSSKTTGKRLGPCD